jgi:MFS family permease
VSSRATLLVGCAATLLVLASFTMPLNLLGYIVPSLGGSTADATWVLSASSLGLAALLLPSGSLADDFGRRRVFLIGGAGFAAASALAAAAPSAAVFIVARAVQGLGSAAMLVSSLALISRAYPDPRGRAMATGMWGAMIGAGIAVGPLAGALLTAADSWRLAYWVLAVAIAVTAVAGRYVCGESRAETARRVDWAGMSLLTAGLVVLIMALVRGNPDGWTSSLVLTLFTAAAVLLAAFFVVEHRGEQPMLDLRLLRLPAFSVTLLASLCLGLTVLSVMAYFASALQSTTGLPPLGVALVLLPWPVFSVALSMLAGTTSRLLGPRGQIATGLAVCAAGTLLLVGQTGSWQGLLVGTAVTGVGTGMLNAVTARTSTTAVPAQRAGMGGGANNTTRYVGSTIGVAVIAGVAHSSTGGPAHAAASLNVVLLGCAGLMLAAALAALHFLRVPEKAPVPAEAGV